ncbi:MFS transporter [Nonomuraea sp. N2-4H]|uniref:MFS transporter n=1 Tax=Nonomuraea sp. N2-4H TaxID=3128898 RepID=UPI003249584D
MITRLLIGRCLSALATALIPTTLTLAVLRAGGGEGELGVVLAAELVPLLVLLPVGGVLADRIRPARVVLLADLTRCLSQAIIAVELLLGVYRVLDLAVLSAMAGVAIAFGSPAVPRLVVAVVPGPDRLRVNARIGVVTSLSAVAAPAIAGTVTVVAGPGWAAGITAAVFACSAWTLGGIRETSPVPEEAVRVSEEAVRVSEEALQVSEETVRGSEETVRVSAEAAGEQESLAGQGATAGPGRGAPAQNAGGSRQRPWRELIGRGSGFGRDLVEGWREVRERPWFLACVAGHGVWHFMAGLFLTLGPVVAVREAGGEAGWAVIVQCGTVGMVLGVFLAPRLPIRRPVVAVQLGAACYAFPMAALAAGASLPVMAAAYAVAMFGLGLLSPLWETVVADEVPEHALGRVRSFDQLISFASRPFGLAVAAPLAGLAGIAAPAVVGGVLVAVVNLAAIVWAPKPRRAVAPSAHGR